MSAAGPRILSRNLLVGVLGAFVLYLGMPETSSAVDRWTLEFAGFIFLSCLGAVFLRFEHSYQDWGCLVGPALGFCYFLGWSFVFDFLKLRPAGSVVGVMALLSVLTATWISLPKLTLVDLLALGLYALGTGGAAVWVATRWPGVSVVEQSLLALFFGVGAVVVTVLGHSVGRRPPKERPSAQHPVAPPHVAPPDPQPPAKLPSHPLPAGASPPPAADFVRTDGKRAFCCGQDPFPAWLFEEGTWHQVALQGRAHDMEWPKAVATDSDGQVFLMTRSDISYDAHIEESIWCDLWYSLRGQQARELNEAPSVRDWWGEPAC